MSIYGTDFINAIHAAKYNYKKEMENKGVDTSKTYFGVMAQDIKTYLEYISDEDFNIIQYDKDGIMMVNYIELIGPMIKTIQELEERITKLEEL